MGFGMTDEKLKAAYERLAFLHSETLAELNETRNRMDAMSRSWWWMLKHRIQVKLGMKSRWG